MSRRLRSGLTVLATAVLLAAGGAAASPAQAAPPIEIVKVHYDSPGADRGSNASLNQEYVVVKNTTRRTLMLTGWTLRDVNGFVFTFPRTSIGAGRTVTVPTGTGTNTPRFRYWNRTWYVWNNTGDTATLRNPRGATVDTCKWGRGGTVTDCR